jgi:hypothetical protein
MSIGCWIADTYSAQITAMSHPLSERGSHAESAEQRRQTRERRFERQPEEIEPNSPAKLVHLNSLWNLVPRAVDIKQHHLNRPRCAEGSEYSIPSIFELLVRRSSAARSCAFELGHARGLTTGHDTGRR